MWIDWRAGRWRVWDLATRAQLCEVGHIVIQGTVEFVSVENNTRGYAVACGVLSVENDRAIIRQKT